VHALDLDPRRGIMAWVRGTPLEQALAAVRGREQDALRELEALLADPCSSPRLRRNAVLLVVELLQVAGEGEAPRLLASLGPAAAPALARVFVRLDAVAARREPTRQLIGGAVAAWDGATLQAVTVFALYVRTVARDEVASAVELLRAAAPALAAVLVAETGAIEERGVLLAGAVAAEARLPAPVRAAGVAALGRVARGAASGPSRAAIEQLRAVRDDPTVGADARRALKGVETSS